MKIMLRAALAAASIASIGSAYAGEGEGVVSNTRFTEIPGVVAQAPRPERPRGRHRAEWAVGARLRDPL